MPNQSDYPQWTIFLKCHPTETFQLVTHIISTAVAMLHDSHLMANGFVCTIADDMVEHRCSRSVLTNLELCNHAIGQKCPSAASLTHLLGRGVPIQNGLHAHGASSPVTQVRGQMLQSRYSCCLDYYAHQIGCIERNAHVSSPSRQHMLQNAAPWNLSESGPRGSQQLHERRRIKMLGTDGGVIPPLRWRCCPLQ